MPTPPPSGARRSAWVQDAEADAIARKRGMSLTIHTEGDRSVPIAGDHRSPPEIDLALRVLDIVADAERVSLDLPFDVMEAWRDCAPVAITHGDVDPAKDFVVTQSKVAQVARFVDQRKWPGAEGYLLRERLITTVAHNVGAEWRLCRGRHLAPRDTGVAFAWKAVPGAIAGF